MTSTDPSTLADAEELGRKAALNGDPIGKNPFSVAQGSPTRVLAIAYRRGYRQGEIESDDANGDLFRKKL